MLIFSVTGNLSLQMVQQYQCFQTPKCLNVSLIVLESLRHACYPLLQHPLRATGLMWSKWLDGTLSTVWGESAKMSYGWAHRRENDPWVQYSKHALGKRRGVVRKDEPIFLAPASSGLHRAFNWSCSRFTSDPALPTFVAREVAQPFALSAQVMLFALQGTWETSPGHRQLLPVACGTAWPKCFPLPLGKFPVYRRGQSSSCASRLYGGNCWKG